MIHRRPSGLHTSRHATPRQFGAVVQPWALCYTRRWPRGLHLNYCVRDVYIDIFSRTWAPHATRAKRGPGWARDAAAAHSTVILKFDGARRVELLAARAAGLEPWAGALGRSPGLEPWAGTLVTRALLHNVPHSASDNKAAMCAERSGLRKKQKNNLKPE